jgi:hypothetical protein
LYCIPLHTCQHARALPATTRTSPTPRRRTVTSKYSSFTRLKAYGFGRVAYPFFILYCRSEPDYYYYYYYYYYYSHTQIRGLNPQANYTDRATERPSDRRLSAKLVPIFADRGCHVVSVTNPYGRILVFLDRSSCYFFQVAPQSYSRG